MGFLKSKKAAAPPPAPTPQPTSADPGLVRAQTIAEQAVRPHGSGQMVVNPPTRALGTDFSNTILGT